MKVTYEDKGSSIYGCVKFDKEEVLVYGDFKSLADMKNFAVKTLANSFDESIEKNLGITFPYAIGDITFYSLTELNNFVLANQKNIDWIAIQWRKYGRKH